MPEDTLFSDSGACYLAAQRGWGQGQVGLFGVPYDGTTSFRAGTRFGPEAIRAVSESLESYDPQLDADLEDLVIRDLGNLDIGTGSPEPVVEAVQRATAELLQAGLHPLILGGEHSITSGAVAAVAKRYPDLVLVQFDAHADLREAYLGSRHNHACAMRRCLEVMPNPGLLQIGIRSGTRQEFQEMQRTGRWVAPEPEALRKALQPYTGRPFYITVDVDAFDPSVMPGTGTPEPGGLSWVSFSALLTVLAEQRIVAADVVELSPGLDTSHCSSVLAAKVTRSLLLLLGQQALPAPKLRENSHQQSLNLA
jgi:agmatinase